MEFDFTQIASLGLGAVIAIIVLNWKRDDDRKHVEALQAFMAEGNRRFELMLDAFQANTEALNGLRETLEQGQRAERMIEQLERRLVGSLEGAQGQDDKGGWR
jgi:hypothetical protein